MTGTRANDDHRRSRDMHEAELAAIQLTKLIINNKPVDGQLPLLTVPNRQNGEPTIDTDVVQQLAHLCAELVQIVADLTGRSTSQIIDERMKIALECSADQPDRTG